MSTAIVEREREIHPILPTVSLPQNWTLSIPDQGVEEEILVITIDSQNKLTCEIKSPNFPDWAIEEINDLESSGKLNRKRLTGILEEALEDLADIIELRERIGQEEVYDWDKVRHEII